MLASTPGRSRSAVTSTMSPARDAARSRWPSASLEGRPLLRSMGLAGRSREAAASRCRLQELMRKLCRSAAGLPPAWAPQSAEAMLRPCRSPRFLLSLGCGLAPVLLCLFCCVSLMRWANEKEQRREGPLLGRWKAQQSLLTGAGQFHDSCRRHASPPSTLLSRDVRQLSVLTHVNSNETAKHLIR